MVRSGPGPQAQYLKPSGTVPKMFRKWFDTLCRIRYRAPLPELLGDALFHDAAHLAAGGVVLDADGQVAEAFAVEEGEPLLREGRGLVLDVLFLGVEGDGVVFHVRFVLVFSDTDTALDRNYCRGIVFSPTYQSLRTSL